MLRFPLVLMIATPLAMGGSALGETVFLGLGDLPGGSFGSIAEGIFGDGTVVVGGSASTASAASGTWPFVQEAFVWTLQGGMDPLGDLAGGEFNSTAFGTSFDGRVVAGSSVVGVTGERSCLHGHRHKPRRAARGMVRRSAGAVRLSAIADRRPDGDLHPGGRRLSSSGGKKAEESWNGSFDSLFRRTTYQASARGRGYFICASKVACPPLML